MKTSNKLLIIFFIIVYVCLLTGGIYFTNAFNRTFNNFLESVEYPVDDLSINSMEYLE